MRRLTIILLLAMLCALTPRAAEAVGPLLGTNCVGSLTAPTTFVDGTALVGTPVYNWWILQGVQTIPARPADVTGVTGTSITGLCVGKAAGQYTLMADDVVNGSESPYGNTFPFILVIPNGVTGITIAPGGLASWVLPTTNTDLTAITGAVSTEIWWMPSTATAPVGPPNMTVTGATTTLTPPAGRYVVFFKALTTPTLGGSTSESAASPPIPFANLIPGPPTNVSGK